MKFSRLAICVLVGAVAAIARAQAPIVEQGTPDDLKSVKTVFVDAGSDLETRDEIGGEIKNKLPGVKILLDAKGAEVVLRYKVEVETGHGGANPRSVIRKVALGEVVKPLERNRERLLMNFRKPLSGSTGFSGPKIGWGKKHPGQDFARAFIKAWQKANSQ
jgi:hypothetical protein